jgi:predicted Zn-dependent protease
MSRTASGSVRVLLLIALLISGCGSAPVGQAILGPRQARAGAEAAKALQEQGMLLPEGEVSGYVREVGERLVRAAPASSGPFEFHVLDMEEPNAFALPGGYVYVSRGLLVLLNSEDELAGVVGHEIGHVVARHHVKQALSDAPLLPVRLATGISGALLSTVSPALGGLVAGTGQVTSALFHAPYSREQETEADEIGQRLAAASGWDPLGITHAMDALGAEERLHGGDPQRRSFFASHPASAERSEHTRRRASGLPRGATAPLAADRAAFLARLEGLAVGPGARHGVFEDSSFLHPELAFALRLPGPPDWKRFNTPGAVAAVRERPMAVILLQPVAGGGDPLAAAREHAPQGARFESAPVATRVNGLAAARARAVLRSEGGPLRAEFWWIALDEQVYRITAACDPAHFDELAASFAKSAESFHRLTSAERSQIREDRLRSARARPGETLASLLARSGSRWTPEEAGVANALVPDAALAAGQLVKITLPEAWADGRS